jgi:Holliday junction resolvase-like predicted endonuclease
MVLIDVDVCGELIMVLDDAQIIIFAEVRSKYRQKDQGPRETAI